MKKILKENKIKILVINQNPAVMIYLIVCPFLFLIFYIITTFVL